jgi:transcription antitermination factor NusG
VTVELPLFANYIFVRIGRSERVAVLETPGALQLVHRSGSPVPLPEAEMNALRAGIQLRHVEPHPLLAIGERVRIVAGVFVGV